MLYTRQNNSGPNLTGANDIVANNIYLINEGQPVNLTDLFINNTYVTDTAYTKLEIDTLLIPKANATDYYNKSQTDFKKNQSQQHRYDECFKYES